MAAPINPGEIVDFDQPLNADPDYSATHVFSTADIVGTFGGLTQGDVAPGATPVIDFSAVPTITNDGVELFPINSEFGFVVTDFEGAVQKDFEGNPEYLEGFAGDLTDGDGAQIGLVVSDAPTDTFKTPAKLGTWLGGLGGNTVKASSEHYSVMLHVLSDQRFPGEPDAAYPLDDNRRMVGGEYDGRFVADILDEVGDANGDGVADTLDAEDFLILNPTAGALPADAVVGSSVAETMDGGDEGDVMLGMAGDDEIAGHKGDDWLSGGDGFDVIRGGRGSDKLYGAAADDLITGYIGADTILGGVGDDTIRGGFGADDLHGGEGINTASYRFSAMGVSVSLAEGVGAGGQAEGDVLTEFENLVGSTSDDVLVGDEGDNALDGLAGDDVLRGRRGDDALDGGMGDDFMVGGLGADTFVFSDADFGRDVVADWTDGEDALDFSALGLDFADFTVSQAGADAVLTLASDPDASLTLLATNSGVIDQFDFI